MQSTQKPFDAVRYVEENSYPLSISHLTTIGLSLRCIDDRASNSDDRKKDIAVPGGGLGMVMDTIGAFTLLRRRGTHASIEPQEAVAAVERALGAITFHTDEKSVKNRGVACGGCGHVSGALMSPEMYLLSENDVKYFLETGLTELKDRLKRYGEKPTVYVGHHSAQGVFVIEDSDVGLPSIGKNGEHAYVYHKYFHELFLSLVAHELVSLMAAHSQGMSEGHLHEALLESARLRLSVTLEKLAAQLPKFTVRTKPTISVKIIP